MDGVSWVFREFVRWRIWRTRVRVRVFVRWCMWRTRVREDIDGLVCEPVQRDAADRRAVHVGERDQDVAVFGRANADGKIREALVRSG